MAAQEPGPKPHIVVKVADAKARGITDVEALTRVAAEAKDLWESRLSRDPVTYLPR